VVSPTVRRLLATFPAPTSNATLQGMRANHWRELARRSGEGVEVALLWNESINCVKVVVSDDRLCHHLDLQVDRADELSAFYHSFTHAASRLPSNV
jgi:hypothetical protein